MKRLFTKWLGVLSVLNRRDHIDYTEEMYEYVKDSKKLDDNLNKLSSLLFNIVKVEIITLSKELKSHEVVDKGYLDYFLSHLSQILSEDNIEKLNTDNLKGLSLSVDKAIRYNLRNSEDYDYVYYLYKETVLNNFYSKFLDLDLTLVVKYFLLKENVKDVKFIESILNSYDIFRKILNNYRLPEDKEIVFNNFTNYSKSIHRFRLDNTCQFFVKDSVRETDYYKSSMDAYDNTGKNIAVAYMVEVRDIQEKYKLDNNAPVSLYNLFMEISIKLFAIESNNFDYETGKFKINIPYLDLLEEDFVKYSNRNKSSLKDIDVFKNRYCL